MINPRNPLFRYFDKAIVVLAAALAVWALNKNLSEDTPAAKTVADVKGAMKQFEQKAKAKQSESAGKIENFSKLEERLGPEKFAPGQPFRDYVFHSPDEIVIPQRVLQYTKDAVQQKVDVIQPTDWIEKARVDKMAITPLGSERIVEVKIDNEKNCITLIPQRVGTTRYRLKFIEGSSLEFPVAVEPYAPPVEPQPETPVEVAAVAEKGYIKLTWKTNKESSPNISYKVFRSKAGAEADEVAEVLVRDRESRADRLGEGQPPTAIVRRYVFSDTSVDEGTAYAYQVQAIGTFKGMPSESNLSEPVKATAISPFELVVKSAFNEMATIEVTRWFGYAPKFKDFGSITRGERVGNAEFDAGCMLIDFNDASREDQKTVKEIQGGRLVEKVVAVLDRQTRVTLLSDSNVPFELWREKSRKPDYEKSVNEFFEKLARKIQRPLPQPQEFDLPHAKDKPEVVIINDSDTTITVGLRGRSKIIFNDIAAYDSRAVVIDDGHPYEIIAGKDKLASAYYESKYSFKPGNRYEFKLGLLGDAGPGEAAAAAEPDASVAKGTGPAGRAAR